MSDKLAMLLAMLDLNIVASIATMIANKMQALYIRFYLLVIANLSDI